MPNLRGKTWATTTPANVGDAQYWEDHLISDAAAAKAASSVQSVNNTTPDAQGNVDIVALPDGGTVGQVLTKQSSVDGDADWEDPASSGHTIQDEDGIDMPYQDTLQFVSAEVTNDAVNGKTVVDCKGSKGDAATITVGTVTTLPAGSQATVNNSGTSSDAVFDFGIPKGADGAGAVDSVNGYTGVVVLNASDVGALPDSTTIPTKTSELDNDSGFVTANSVEEEIEQIYADNGVLGAKNLLENKATTQTVNGITYTVNSDDGSITANGTATASADLIINQGFQIAEKCIMSGCPTGGGSSTYRLMYTSYGGEAIEYADTGNGVEINNISILTNPYVRVVFRVSNGQTVNNIIIKPMVRLASDPDDTYVPNAMTNRELTKKALMRGLVLTSSNDLNDIKTTGLYGITTAPTNSPESKTYGTLIVQATTSGDVRQMFIKVGGADGFVYVRAFGGNPGFWTSWFKFTGTVVS
jgi:hypothetical protein